MQENKIGRREFLGEAAAVAAFTIIPRHVMGGPGHVPPSEKLNIAAIGVGGRGADDLRELESQNLVALCDVDEVRAADTFKRYPHARKYKDFREMLDKEDKNIDAVVVATPDHMHAVAAMAAMKRGKHVYCEKPLTHSVYEARVLAETARAQKVATQMGNQGQAGDEVRIACETVWDGAIGQVGEVHVWTDRPLLNYNQVFWAQGIERPKETPAIPDTLSWDLWLGPAPYRPYHPAYAPFTWRGWWDFGTGALGDMGCHELDPVFRVLKLGHPTSVEVCCTHVNDETYPVASRVTYNFPARGEMAPVQVNWYDGGMKPPRPAEWDDRAPWGVAGTLYVGDKGKMLGHRLIPNARAIEYGKPPQKLPRSPGHHAEWIAACKGGQPAGSNFDHAGLVAQVVLLGNIALRPALKEKLASAKLLWDGANMKITNIPEANQYLQRTYRAGWSL